MGEQKFRSINGDLLEKTPFKYVPQTIAADDATPDVSGGTLFVGPTTGSAIVMTDLDNPEVGQIVTILGGSSTQTIRINAGGNFDIPEDVVLGAGDSITFFVNADNDYKELSRTIVNRTATIAADDVTPDVSLGEIFTTSANTGATALTDLDNPRVGSIITLVGGSDTNATTIDASAATNFTIAGDVTLGAGDSLTLYIVADNDYQEIARSTANAT